MRILLLSDTYSEHTEKWALGLANEGIEIGLFSFNKASYAWYSQPNITVLFEPHEKIAANKSSTKLSYLAHVKTLRQKIKQFRPDIVHAHYSTSYGLIGALSGFHPYVISSWGTDVMKFPQKNFIAKTILKFNFSKADLLCATSNTIKNFIKPVSAKQVTVIPFGVNVNTFRKSNFENPFGENAFVIGSIKPLEEIYNNHILIQSFALLSAKHHNMRLMIIGEGSEEHKLKELCDKLNVSDKVMFTGRIPFEKISQYFNMLDVLANLSEYESFGVSVIEAMACEKPVVVTNVGGLKEVVVDDTVGLKVEPGNVDQTVAAIENLVLNKELCIIMGKNAREHVLKNYNWDVNLHQMISEYKKLISDFKGIK